MRLKTYTILASFLILVAAATATAGDYAMGKPPTSFRGLAWGVSLEEAPGLLPVEGFGYKDTYFRTDEPLMFGDAEIQSVAYYFRKGRFYRVGVAFAGRANHFLLKEQLIYSYGPGRGVGRRYGWMWPEFSIEINFDDESKTGALYYTFEGKLD